MKMIKKHKNIFILYHKVNKQLNFKIYNKLYNNNLLLILLQLIIINL